MVWQIKAYNLTISESMVIKTLLHMIIDWPKIIFFVAGKIDETITRLIGISKCTTRWCCHQKLCHIFGFIDCANDKCFSVSWKGLKVEFWLETPQFSIYYVQLFVYYVQPSAPPTPCCQTIHQWNSLDRQGISGVYGRCY